MNAHLKAHGKHMLIGGGGVAVLLVVLGVGWQQAVSWGLLLACPVGMLGMMWVMGRHVSGAGQPRGGAADQPSCHGTAPDAGQQRVSAPSVPGPRPGA